MLSFLFASLLYNIERLHVDNMMHDERRGPMGILSHFKFSTKEFGKQWPSYLLLFISLHIVLQVAVAFFNGAAAWILHLQNIPYISYTNLDILIQKPVATLLLLLLFLLLILTVFMQFTYLLLGMRQIKQRRFNLIQLVKESWAVLRRQSWQSILFLLCYFIVIIQAAQEVFGSQLLGKIVIPTFIVDFIVQNLWLGLFLFLAAVIVGYIAIRWIFVLPLIILSELSAKEAVARSVEMTRWKFWRYTIQLWALGTLTAIPRVLTFGIIYFAQVILDDLSAPIALFGGLANLSFIQILNVFFSAWTSVVLLTFLLNQPELADAMNKTEPVVSWRATRWMKTTSISVITIASMIIVSFNVIFLLGVGQTIPKTISHRGVDGVEHPNGAQNTIPALKKTSKLHPDFVEMDIQETKDKQFVVMHDHDLKALTGVSGAPQDYTLAELQRMTVKEHGYSAPLPSFDDYLTAANEANQKLLVEIKTLKKDSPDMMKIFLNKYEGTLLAYGHEVQSLDYTAVASVKEKAPLLYVSYILPFNFIYPHTDANAYTMEETTLNKRFTSSAHATGKQVYAWTINDSDTMRRVMSYHVDAVITDELTTLQQEIKAEQAHPTYAQRIQDYIVTMPNVSGATVGN